MEGRIVYQGTAKDGTPFLIRYGKEGDAPAMQAYINALSKEQTYIRLQGKQFTLEEEEAVLQSQLKAIQEHTGVSLLVFANDTLVGISGITMQYEATKHVGDFGISLANESRAKGMGKILMRITLQEAVDTIPQLQIVSLSVFAHNQTAHALYKSFGFIEYGSMPKGLVHKGEYHDHLYMHKVVRNI